MNTATLDFEKDVLQSEIPVLVDFTAAWCGPCQAIAPVIDELTKEFAGRAKVIKVDVDQHGELAGRYGIMSIPALVVYKNGQEVDRIVGAASKDSIEQLLEQYI